MSSICYWCGGEAKEPKLFIGEVVCENCYEVRFLVELKKQAAEEINKLRRRRRSYGK